MELSEDACCLVCYPVVLTVSLYSFFFSAFLFIRLVIHVPAVLLLT